MPLESTYPFIPKHLTLKSQIVCSNLVLSIKSQERPSNILSNSAGQHLAENLWQSLDILDEV